MSGLKSGRPTPWRATAGLLAGLALLVSCSHPQSAAAPGATAQAGGAHRVPSVHQAFSGSGRPKLQFEGDSIILQARGDIDRRFGGSYDVAVEATVGFDTLLEAKHVAQQARLHPRIEVINLGTNDANRLLTGLSVLESRQTLTAVEGRLATFDHEFGPSTCVIFVTVNSHNPSWNPAGARAINAYLRSHAAHLADWDAAWSAGYFDRPDTPHPNEKGRQALLAVIGRAMAGCPA